MYALHRIVFTPAIQRHGDFRRQGMPDGSPPFSTSAFLRWYELSIYALDVHMRMHNAADDTISRYGIVLSEDEDDIFRFKHVYRPPPKTIRRIWCIYPPAVHAKHDLWCILYDTYVIAHFLYNTVKILASYKTSAWNIEGRRAWHLFFLPNCMDIETTRRKEEAWWQQHIFPVLYESFTCRPHKSIADTLGCY